MGGGLMCVETVLLTLHVLLRRCWGKRDAPTALSGPKGGVLSDVFIHWEHATVAVCLHWTLQTTGAADERFELIRSFLEIVFPLTTVKRSDVESFISHRCDMRDKASKREAKAFDKQAATLKGHMMKTIAAAVADLTQELEKYKTGSRPIGRNWVNTAARVQTAFGKVWETKARDFQQAIQELQKHAGANTEHDQQRAAADDFSTEAVDTMQQQGHDELACDLASAEPTVDTTDADRDATEAELKTTIVALQQRCSELSSEVGAANEAIEMLKADREASVTEHKIAIEVMQNQVTTFSESVAAAELKHKHEVAALRQRCAELETQLVMAEVTAQAHSERSSTAPREAATADDVEQLQREYDDRNEQIILNQQALDMSILQLAQQPLDDEEEKTRLDHENEEMRMILGEQWENRRRIVAKLVLHQWRPDRRRLETWAKDKTTADVEAIQHTCHDACFELSSEI